MASIRLKDYIPNLTFVSITSVKFPATGTLPVIATVGGGQFKSNVDVSLSSAVTGAGGLDTGSLGIYQLWYVHFVVSNGSLALVASLSKTAPTGFTTFLWSGCVFRTNSSSQIETVSNSNLVITGTWTPTFTNISNTVGGTQYPCSYVIKNGTITVVGRTDFSASATTAAFSLTLPVTTSSVNGSSGGYSSGANSINDGWLVVVSGSVLRFDSLPGAASLTAQAQNFHATFRII